jgi:hypothetical protein
MAVATSDIISAAFSSVLAISAIASLQTLSYSFLLKHSLCFSVRSLDFSSILIAKSILCNTQQSEPAGLPPLFTSGYPDIYVCLAGLKSTPYSIIIENCAVRCSCFMRFLLSQFRRRQSWLRSIRTNFSLQEEVEQSPPSAIFNLRDFTSY